MDLALLKAELQTDPLNRGYADMLARGTGELPNALNAQDRDIVKTVWLNDRGMTSILVPQHGVSFCDAIFTKFELAATSSKTVQRMVNRLYTDPQGLNFGDAGLRSMFEAWRGTLLNGDQVDALLSLGLAKGSRAEELLGRAVTEIDIQNALEYQDGND